MPIAKNRRSANFLKRRDRLIRCGVFAQSDYDEFLELCKKDIRSHQLRPHKIFCSSRVEIISLSFPSSQIRVLAQILCKPKIVIFIWIGKHREYETIISDKRNCKKFASDCDKAEEMMCL